MAAGSNVIGEGKISACAQTHLEFGYSRALSEKWESVKISRYRM